MTKQIPYDDDQEEEKDELDTRKIAMYTEPVVADGMTNLIVELLNQNNSTPDQIYRSHMGHARRKRS